MFVYCNNNPSNSADPSGHICIQHTAAIAAPPDCELGVYYPNPNLIKEISEGSRLNKGVKKAWNSVKGAASDAWSWTKGAASDTWSWITIREHWRGLVEVGVGIGTCAISIIPLLLPDPTGATKRVGVIGISVGIGSIVLGVDDICQ